LNLPSKNEGLKIQERVKWSGNEERAEENVICYYSFGWKRSTRGGLGKTFRRRKNANETDLAETE
jgi:hypothetical protein